MRQAFWLSWKSRYFCATGIPDRYRKFFLLLGTPSVIVSPIDRVLRLCFELSQQFARAVLERPGVVITELHFDVLTMRFHSGSADAELLGNAAHTLFASN